MTAQGGGLLVEQAERTAEPDGPQANDGFRAAAHRQWDVESAEVTVTNTVLDEPRQQLSPRPPVPCVGPATHNSSQPSGAAAEISRTAARAVRAGG